jgi:undecaprenyl-diphosphatase
VPYTRAGDHGLLWVGLGVVAGDPLGVAATVWGTLGANYAVKLAVGRRRPLGGPPPLVRAPDTPSFPSSHAAMSVAAAFALSRAVPPLTPVWAAMAGAMALTRVYVRVHHPADVAAGAALGAVAGTIAVAVR